MKILYITSNLSGDDGWSRYSKDIVTGIQELGNDVVCVTSKECDLKIKQYPVLEDATKYLFNPIKSWQTARNVNKIIKDFTPDLVHFLVEPYINLLPFLKIRRKKVFLTVHGTYSYYPNLFDTVFKKFVGGLMFNYVFARLFRVIAVSNFTKKYLLSYYNNEKAKEKVLVLSNGINLKSFPYFEKNIKRSENVKNILFVGTVKPRKGIKETLASLKIYKETFSENFLYYIVGHYKTDDSYFKELIRIIKNDGLEKNVIWVGFISDFELLNYYKQTDLFILLSINDSFQFEGFGLVYLEANSQGVPVIGSLGSGAEDAIIDNQTGFLVNPSSSGVVAEKIDLILNKHVINDKNCINHAMDNAIGKKNEQLFKIYNK